MPLCMNWNRGWQANYRVGATTDNTLLKNKRIQTIDKALDKIMIMIMNDKQYIVDGNSNY